MEIESKSIKEEILVDGHISYQDQSLREKIIDYQFFVAPKIEEIDIKPDLVSKYLKEDETFGDNSFAECDDKDFKPVIIRKFNHSDESKLHFCEQCDFKTNRKYNLKRHNYLHTFTKEVRHFCEHCDFETKRKDSLKRHNYIHTLSQEDRQTLMKKYEKEYSCEQCDMKYKSKNKFQLHLSSVHLKNILYSCQQCDYKTYGKCYLTRHVQNVHQNKQRAFQCDICGFSFTQSRYLRQHYLLHKDERNYSCDICAYKAKTKSNLVSHKNIVHLKKSIIKHPTVCEVCGKEYKSKYQLTYHLVQEHKKDIEVKTYICDTCGYKSINKNAFSTHVLQHSINKTYMYCANCDYKTYNKTNLVQHMVKHMQHVKMHKCSICSFETKRPHTLRHHIKTHSK